MAGMAKKHKKFPIEAVFIAIVVIIIVLVLFLSQKAKETGAVASVNGQAITLADLNTLNMSVPVQQRQLLTKDNLTEIAINNMIMGQEITKRGITVSKQEVDALVERFIAQNNLTMQGYEKLLQQQGVTVDFIKNLYAEQLLQFKLMNETVLNSVTVSDDETLQFYNMYKEQINDTYENSKVELKDIVKFQKAQQSFLVFIQQLRAKAEIKYY